MNLSYSLLNKEFYIFFVRTVSI